MVEDLAVLAPRVDIGCIAPDGYPYCPGGGGLQQANRKASEMANGNQSICKIVARHVLQANLGRTARSKQLYEPSVCAWKLGVSVRE